MKAEEALQLHGVGSQVDSKPPSQKASVPQPRPFHRVLGPLPFLSSGVLASGAKG
jgi:hypothetical protein